MWPFHGECVIHLLGPIPPALYMEYRYVNCVLGLNTLKAKVKRSLGDIRWCRGGPTVDIVYSVTSVADVRRGDVKLGHWQFGRELLSNAKKFESLECMTPANVADEDLPDKAKAQSYRGSGGGEGKVHIDIVLQEQTQTRAKVELNGKRRGSSRVSCSNQARLALNDVGKCCKNVFLRIWNTSWSRQRRHT